MNMTSKTLTHICFMTILLIFSGCGGSSSGSTISNDDAALDDSPSDESPSTPTSLAPENEPYYKYAWHIKSKNSIFNTMNYTVDQNADINITEAWKITKGKNVKVAVIDDAFDIVHEDLKANITVAYNADNDTSDVTNQNPIGITDEDGYPMDGSHGNTCAGFIVAPVNGKGIVGTAPESKLIAIKQTINSDAFTIKAFEYAKNQGAKVISCSWGTENISSAVEAELKSLYDAGITILFASGNDTKNLDDVGINDESESQWVIGIGASNENNDVTVYSNYGKEIDVLAPGGNSEESIGILGIDDSGERGEQNQKNLVTNSYAFTNGTSFSTPVAAGVVALMYAANPDITPDQVRTLLIENSAKIGENKASYINGFDEKRAYGKINAGKAVVAAKNL